MHIGIVTGASRGLGLALTRALGDAAGASSSTRATRDALAPRVAVAAATSSRSPATSPTPRIAARSSRPPATASTCSSTTRARSGRARSRRSPTTRSTSCGASTRSTCSRRSRSSQLALPRLAPGAAIVNVTLRRRRRAVRGLGRLRLVEGGARAAHGDPRRRASRTCASTRSTPATCGRRCSRRRSPARTSPTGRCRRTSVPGLLALIDGDAAERPLPRARARRRQRMSALALGSACSRHTSRPRRAAIGRDDVALLVAERADGRRSRTRASTSCRGSSRRATCSSSTPRRRCRRRSTRGSADAPRRAAPLDARPAAREWVVELRAADGSPLRRPPDRRLARPARRRPRRAARAVRGQRRGCGVARPRARPAAGGVPRAPRHADPLRLRPRAWPLDAYQTVFALEPGERRDAERRPAVHDRAGDRARRRAASSSPR